MIRSSHPTRPGSTVLWCLTAILAVLALGSFWRSYATTHLRMRAREMELEWRFETLARSLIAGVEVQLRLASNRPGPFAELLRRRLDRPEARWVDLTPMVDTELARAPLARKEAAGFSLVDLTAGLARQVPVFPGSEEKVAILVVRARLKLPGTALRRSTRELEVVRSIRVSRTGVAPELRRFGLFIGQAGGLTDLARANQLREEFCRRTAPLHAALAAARDGATGAARQEWARILDHCPDPASPHSCPPRLPEPSGWAYYGLERRTADWDLANVDLARTLDEQRRTLDALQARAEATLRAGTSDGAGIARQLVEELRKGLFRIWAYNSLFRIVPLDSAGSAATRPFVERLEYAAVSPRVQFVLREGAERPSVEDQLYAMLGRPGVTNGVIELENSKSPVTLRGAIPGSLLIVAGPGGLVLDGLNARGQAGPLVTVHARAGPVSVRGRCRAVVTLGRSRPGEPPLALAFAPGSELIGALMMARLPDSVTAQGTLVNASAPLAATGASDATAGSQGLVAILSPRIMYQRVVRP